MKNGRRNLEEYNKKQGTEIHITRERTRKVQDQEKLGLYIRRKVREACVRSKTSGVDVSLVKGFIRIQNEPLMRPVVAAIRLALSMQDWIGPKLEDMYTEQDRKDLESGKLVYGSLKLPGVDLSSKPSTSNVANEATSANQAQEESSDQNVSVSNFSQQSQNAPKRRKFEP